MSARGLQYDATRDGTIEARGSRRGGFLHDVSRRLGRLADPAGLREMNVFASHARR